jgi:hypothetical protein
VLSIGLTVSAYLGEEIPKICETIHNDEWHSETEGGAVLIASRAGSTVLPHATGFPPTRAGCKHPAETRVAEKDGRCLHRTVVPVDPGSAEVVMHLEGLDLLWLDDLTAYGLAGEFPGDYRWPNGGEWVRVRSSRPRELREASRISPSRCGWALALVLRTTPVGSNPPSLHPWASFSPWPLQSLRRPTVPLGPKPPGRSSSRAGPSRIN